MKLPNASEAEVPEAKIVRYLFFLRHGFRIEEWAKLAKALRQHASENEVTRREPTPLGERFVIDGLIALADGSTTMLRVVWFIERGETIARLATAYPVRSGF